MVLCTLILGSILKNGKKYVDEGAEEEFMFRCRSFIQSFRIGDRPPAPRRTFEAFWEYRWVTKHVGWREGWVALRKYTVLLIEVKQIGRMSTLEAPYGLLCRTTYFEPVPGSSQTET